MKTLIFALTLGIVLVGCAASKAASTPPLPAPPIIREPASHLSACLDAGVPFAEQCECLRTHSVEDIVAAWVVPMRPHQHGDAQDRAQDADYRQLAYSAIERARELCREGEPHGL